MEFGFTDIWRIIKKRWIMIITITVLAILITAAISFFLLEPEYEVTSTLIVQSEREGNQISYNNLITNQSLLRTYTEIFRSRTITEDVIQRLNLDLTAEELLNKTRFSSIEDSLITRVTVIDNDTQRAVDIANGFALSFRDNLKHIMNVDNVSILDEAKLSDIKQIKPRPYLNITITCILGLLFSIGLAFIREVHSNAIESEEEIQQLLNIPSLGVIATYNNNRKLISRYNPKSPISEAYRTLRTNIQYDPKLKNIKSILITSTTGMEGKTTTITNLAVTMMENGKRVIVIDGDLRKPSVHYHFQIENKAGLSELLRAQTTLEESIVSVYDNLDVITAGQSPINPSELLGSRQMQEILAQVENNYDLILIDSPPVLPVTDGQILANYVNAVILVVHSGKVSKNYVVKTKALLDRVGGNVIGVVVNNKKMEHEEYYAYYSSERVTGKLQHG